MRIPTKETEIGIVWKSSCSSNNPLYYWTSLETTYGMNYGKSWYHGQQMTYSDYNKLYPYRQRYGTARSKQPINKR